MLPSDTYLEKISVKLPNTNCKFMEDFLELISEFGDIKNRVLQLAGSCQFFSPRIEIDFQSQHTGILTDFILSDGESLSVNVENSTGLEKPSPFSYHLLSVETVTQRLTSSGIRLVGIDHVGFNLPWFAPGVHPEIFQLREKLSPYCLYHQFPTGEPWDFIIPGDKDEIARRHTVDYTEVRKPKFELVSFENASKPLIQFDVSVNVEYVRFLSLFPEALNDPELKNIWIYLESPYPVDICLVINEFVGTDWSAFFKGHRL